MRYMLKALGFWIWGLIAIGIAVSVVPLGYRVATLWRLHDVSASSDPSAPSGTTPSQSQTDTSFQPAAISRLIGPEISAARQALQRSDWTEALRQLAAAAAKSPLTAFDKKTISDFRGFAYVRLNNLRAAQDAYEAALATGAYTPEETLKTNQIVFRLAAGNGDYTTAARYGKLTNKTNYWNMLLRIERQDERDDHNLLMVYRVMYDTSSMTAGSDNMEMAQLLGDAALPGEAQMVVDKATATGLFTDQQDKDRATRMLNSLKPHAEADKNNAAKFDAEAAKNPTGELDVKSGEIYFGAGDYQSAVTAIDRAIQKGQIKHLDEAYVYLGRSQVALKNDAEAARAFAHLKTVPGISDRVLRLWTLYAESALPPPAPNMNAG